MRAEVLEMATKCCCYALGRRVAYPGVNSHKLLVIRLVSTNRHVFFVLEAILYLKSVALNYVS